MDLQHWLFVLVSIGAALFAVAFVIVRRRREDRDRAAHEKVQQSARVLPVTLYPVIDPNICIGSLSCLKACPEGDILGVVDGVAKLIEPANCIGHGRCAAECPVNAIKLVFGSAERGVDLPEVNQYFESSRSGVHVVGELGGMGLIKNSVSQGVQCAEFLTKKLRGSGTQGLVDVAIVGAGPAGLATAVACRAAGLSFHLLEQDTVGGAIAHYPRQKVVMSEPVELPLYGKIHKQFISKEELLSTWKDVLSKTKIRVNEGLRVNGLKGEDGDFRVQTAKGDVKAKKVVLAVGRRGTPRRLNVPGENLPKVSYRLVDPQQYEGCHVLVVGGGDSAMEAAAQLAEKSDAQVTLCHRGESFERGRPANRERVHELAEQRRLRLLFNGGVVKIGKDSVVLTVGGQPRQIQNDFVIVCAGGEMPLAFLDSVGVKVQRFYGTSVGEDPHPDAPSVAKAPRGSAKEEQQRRKDARFAWLLFALGAVIVGVMAWMGKSYYLLPVRQRAASSLHAMLRPSGPVGHGIGIVSTLFLLTNFLYSLRKRWRTLKRTGRIKRWLTVHMFIGYMGPFTIAFHAAFQSKNQLATFTAISLGIVVLTGVVGRFFYGLVPSDNGRMLELSDIMARWNRMRDRMEPLLAHVHNPAPVRALFKEATEPPRGQSMMAFVLHLPTWRLRTKRKLHHLKRVFDDPAAYEEFETALDRIFGLRASVTFYKSLRGFFSSWRLLHASLAVFLALMIVAHIAVEMYLGYFWIFK
jgi:thioredoxin reductase/NAD-dependent dihydropyrimidine dehydrogenase PreA subunit